MKIPKHILKNISNERYHFEDSAFNKISFDSYFITIPFTEIKSNEKGTLHITKTKNHIYIYSEFKRNITQEIIHAMEVLKEYISKMKPISKKVNNNQLEISIVQRNVNFDKIKNKKKIKSTLKSILNCLLIFVFFILATIHSLSFDNQIFGFRAFLTYLLAFLSFYMIYRISNSPSKVFLEKSIKLFVVFSLSTCLSLCMLFII